MVEYRDITSCCCVKKLGVSGTHPAAILLTLTLHEHEMLFLFLKFFSWHLKLTKYMPFIIHDHFIQNEKTVCKNNFSQRVVRDLRHICKSQSRVNICVC